VNLEQGLQMLTIFKSHEAGTTILEDFDFYEQREKALQENRRQQQAASTDPRKLVDTKLKFMWTIYQMHLPRLLAQIKPTY
jgi:YTH domain-containing family protein